MRKTIFLFGGSGFIGKNLVDVLNRDFQIFVFDRFIDSDFFGRYPEINTLAIELDKATLPHNLPSPDFIINLASIVTAERDMSLFDSMISSNVKVLIKLYERFKDDPKLKLFIQFGSSEEYGSEGAPFKETMRENPGSPYALIKQLTTNLALMLWRNYHFPACVVRPGNLYGKYQPETKFLPYVISRLKRNEPLEVTPCEQRRDFIEAQEFAKHIGQLIEHYEKCVGEIINVSSGKDESLKSLIEKYQQELGSSSEVNYGAIPYREGEAMNLCCDITKLKNIIG